MSGLLGVVMFRIIMGARVMLMKFFGAIRTFEFMAFAGNTGKGDGHDEQREKFHRRAS